MQGMGNNGEEIVLTGKKSFTCFRKETAPGLLVEKYLSDRHLADRVNGTARFYYFDDYRGHHRKGIIVLLK